MFGQLWVAPLDGLGEGDGDAANAGDASMNVATAPTPTIGAMNNRRLDALVFGCVPPPGVVVPSVELANAGSCSISVSSFCVIELRRQFRYAS
jgi:hypothetical protein